MAKKTVATFSTGEKGFTKVIRMVKYKKGSYTFKEEILPTDEVDNYLLINKEK